MKRMSIAEVIVTDGGDPVAAVPLDDGDTETGEGENAGESDAVRIAEIQAETTIAVAAIEADVEQARIEADLERERIWAERNAEIAACKRV
jgi:hypothetical protein